MFKTILLPVDLGEESSWEKALPAALLHARSDGGSLTVLTVVPDFGEGIVGTSFPPDFIDRLLASAKKELATFCAAHVPKDMPVKTMIRCGRIYHEIIDAAKQIDADLIVMASHRPAFRDYLIGPNAERVMRHANCSVLVVRS
jgi:nucleotide-binding universal stress UspA family protein